MRKSPSCASVHRQSGEANYFCPLLKTERRSSEEEICSVCDAFYRATEKDERLERAFFFAAKAHAGQMRKGSDIPYLIHLVRTWAYVQRLTDSSEEQAAALLHDVLEDTSVTLKELRDIFGAYIAALVEAESECKRAERPPAETWEIRKMETLNRLHRIMQREDGRPYLHIALGDKLANLFSMSFEYAQKGEQLCQKFNQKDKRMHAWYYGELGMIFGEYFTYGAEKLLVQEYFQYYKEIFGSIPVR